MTLLKACSCILVRFEKNCALPMLHVNFPRSDGGEPLSSLLTKGGLRRMQKEEHRYAADMTVLFVASFIERTLALKAQCDLIRMSVHYIRTTSNALVSRRDVH